MADKIYDVLKFIALVFLPTFATMYFVLAKPWDLPSAQAVVYTTLACNSILGALVYMASVQYRQGNDGEIEITRLPAGTKQFSLNLRGDPEKLEEMRVVRFKVTKSDDRSRQ